MLSIKRTLLAVLSIKRIVFYFWSKIEKKLKYNALINIFTNSARAFVSMCGKKHFSRWQIVALCGVFFMTE